MFIYCIAVCKRPVDLVIAIDTTVAQTYWAKYKSYVTQVINKLDIGAAKIRVAIVTYKETPVIVNNFNERQTRAQIIAIINTNLPVLTHYSLSGSGLSLVAIKMDYALSRFICIIPFGTQCKIQIIWSGMIPKVTIILIRFVLKHNRLKKTHTD